jgi:hypothetical protein
MALLINRTNLKKSDGTDLPSTDVLVKFMFQSEFDGFNQRFLLRYYVSPDFKNDGYSTINVKYGVEQTDENDNVSIVYQDLTSDFVKELDQQIIAQYEALVDGLFPQGSTSMKTIFTYHLFIKEKLEEILGADTVTIRLDIS